MELIFTTTKNVKTGLFHLISSFFVQYKKDSLSGVLTSCENQAAFLFCRLRITSRVTAISTRDTGSTIQAFWTKPARI